MYLAIKHIFPDVPINAGCFEPLHIADPHGTFLYARYPRPVSGCAAEVSSRIAESVFTTLSAGDPRRPLRGARGHERQPLARRLRPAEGAPLHHVRLLAAAGTAATWRTTGSRTAARPSASRRRSRPRCSSSTIRCCSSSTRCASGRAARARRAAASASTTASASGAARGCLVPDGPRPRRAARPLRRPRRRAERGGPGAGRAHVRVAALVEGRGHPRDGGRRSITVRTPGGGGYGDPLERDPALVRRDVARGYFTVEDAERDYGVVLRGAPLDGRCRRHRAPARREGQAMSGGADDHRDAGVREAGLEVREAVGARAARAARRQLAHDRLHGAAADLRRRGRGLLDRRRRRRSPPRPPQQLHLADPRPRAPRRSPRRRRGGWRAARRSRCPPRRRSTSPRSSRSAWPASTTCASRTPAAKP